MGWFLPEQDALRRNNGVMKIRTHDEPAELGRASIKNRVEMVSIQNSTPFEIGEPRASKHLAI